MWICSKCGDQGDGEDEYRNHDCPYATPEKDEARDTLCVSQPSAWEDAK
jgi:hypothetical protein